MIKPGDQWIVEVQEDGSIITKGILVRCGNCKHAPYLKQVGKTKNVVTNRLCPLSYIPADDFYCAAGEEEEVFYE